MQTLTWFQAYKLSRTSFNVSAILSKQSDINHISADSIWHSLHPIPINIAILERLFKSLAIFSSVSFVSSLCTGILYLYFLTLDSLTPSVLAISNVPTPLLANSCIFAMVLGECSLTLLLGWNL